MLLLSYLVPGKYGRILRKIIFPMVGVLILYIIIWAIVLNNIKFNVINQFESHNGYTVVFDVKNKSFASVEILDINIYDKNENIVKKKTKDLPATIEGYENKNITLAFEKANYKQIEVTVRALLKSYTIKNEIN